MRRGERGALRASGPQERPLPTLNAVLMPATTGLPPRLQRRTCSRNRFSFLLYDGSLVVLSSSRSSSAVCARSPSSNGVFGGFSLSLAFPRSREPSFLALSPSRLPLISFSCPLSCSSNVPFSLSFSFADAPPLSLAPLLSFCSCLAFFRARAFALVLLLAHSSAICPSLCIFARTLVLCRLIHFLLIVALAVDEHDASFGHDLSLYRVDRPRQGRRFSIDGGGKISRPISEFRTVWFENHRRSYRGDT